MGQRTLVSHALKTLNDVVLDDIILYSSTDLSNYIDKDVKYTWVKRNKKLDGDNTTFNEVLDSIVDNIKGDYIVFLSCTSPFITTTTIGSMLGRIIRGENDSAFTALKHQGFAWYDGESLNYDPSNIPRTQDISPVYLETSGLYIFSKEMYKETHRRIGFNPYIREVDIMEGWDIDTEFDFSIAKMIAERRL